MTGLASVFFFWVILLNPGHLGGPGENHFYPTVTSCENVRTIYEHGNSGLPGFRIAPKCIELKRTGDE